MDSAGVSATAAPRRCANCAAQPTAPTDLSRCSRCKLAAYCSKTCQADHWRRSHRSQCAALRLSDRFRALESKWWRSRSADELRDFAARTGLDPASMRFFGEVLFLLGGLKPAVLFSNLPSEWRCSFAADVVVASGVLEEGDNTCSPLGLFVVADGVATAAEYDLSGELALVSARVSGECEAASARLRLQRVLVENRGGVELPALGTAKERHVVGEGELARLLDYPVALSECREPMLEIGYFLSGNLTLGGDDGDGSDGNDDSKDASDGNDDSKDASARAGAGLLLTSFCANSGDERHRARVAAHFQRYRALWESYALGRSHGEGGGRLQLVQTRI